MTNKNNKPKQASPKSKSSPKTSLPLEVALRRQYYKDGAGFMGKIAATCLICLAISIVISVYATNKKAANRYIAVNHDGSLIELTPLNKPNQSEAVVKSWVVDALVNTFAFNYLDYKFRLNNSLSSYFTNSGGSELIGSLKEIDLFEIIQDKKLLVSMHIDTAPILIGSGILPSGAFAWKFEMTGIITLRNEKDSFTIPVKMAVTVSRRDLLSHPKGLGIARVFIEKDRSRTQ